MLNQVIMMGRLTADPELKQTQGGVSVTKFTIAVERNYTVDNGKRETDFFDVVSWRSTADFIARYFTKGQLIAIVGSLENQKWTDQSGNKRVTAKIIADQAFFSGDFQKKEEQSQPAASTQRPSYATQPAPATFVAQSDDDLPF